MIPKTTRKRRSEGGQTMVEFAVVLPVFLLLLLGIVQFGIVFNHYVSVTDAVRVGARFAGVQRTYSGTNSQRCEAVKDKVTGSAPSLASATFRPTITINSSSCPSSSAWTPGADLRVCASYPFSISIIGLVVRSGNLSSCTTNRVE